MEASLTPLAVAVLGVAVAAVSLGWAVTSWRLTGGHLRVQALLYRQVLVLWVFNAGRTAESIDKLVLGGTRGGIGGHDLTPLLGKGGVRLEPGQSWRAEVDPATALPPSRFRHSSRGWDSVWLLLGSMRQRRAELVPVADERQPEVGWRLVPRRVKLSRYAPAAALVAVLTAAAFGWSPLTQITVVVLGAVVVARAYLAAVSERRFQRLRVERWLLFAGLVLAIAAAETKQSSPVLPPTLEWALIGYAFLAAALAIPGAVPRLADGLANLRRATDRARRSAIARACRLAERGRRPAGARTSHELAPASIRDRHHDHGEDGSTSGVRRGRL